MEFRQNIRGSPFSASSKKIYNTELTAKYPLALQLYELPPNDNVSLQEFGEFAIERLKVLRILEKTRLKHIRNTREFKDALLADLRKEGLLAYVKKTPDKGEVADPEDYEDRRKDHISHFVLRLAYCKTEDLRRWFMKQESDLFLLRLENESRETISRFLEISGMHFEPISESEKKHVYDKVRQVSMLDVLLTESTDFYKVHFTEVLDLVGKRRVYLEKGFAFIKLREMSHIITSRFRSSLSRSLAIMARALPNLEEDPRLMSMLGNLHMRYVGKDYSAPAADGQITRQMIDGLSDKSFPPCMKQLHQVFRDGHHLRHGGRLQYTLFLKGIGMSLEEVLAMWREEFTKIMDADKFEKQYSYNIRHSFGKEGKRVNYTPYSCMKIIMSNAPGNGDHHGCPFRHSDQGLLRERLASYKVASSGVHEIMDLVSKGHYQIACSRYFELTNNTVLKQSINHPNEFFEESYKLARGLTQPVKDSGFKPVASMVYASQINSSQKLQGSQTTSSLPQESEMMDAFENDDEFDSMLASME